MFESTKRDPSARHWRSWLRMAQMVVTLSLIAWLFSQIEWSSLWSLLIHARWGLVTLSMALLIVNHMINVGRWQYLLEQRAVGFGTLLVLYGAGVFSNNFLPTGIGGDGVRVALLSRYVPLR